MLIEKTQSSIGYAYQILVSFKTSVTYIKFSCVRCEAEFVAHNSVFFRTFYDIHAWKYARS